MTSRIPAAAAAVLLALTLAACSAAPAARPSSASKPPKPAPSPAASVDPVETSGPEETPGALTCESMISQGTVEALTAAGWTAKPVDFIIGDLNLSDGLLCFWADYSVASDHGQLYGWSRIDAEAAADAQSALIAQGWRREDGPKGVYITEDPQYSMGVDDDGYGSTYLFGDGWVKFSDTKQGLVLISDPA